MNNKKVQHIPLQGISLITICLNSASTIGRTIESIAAQKDDHVQYIVIDGGSTDGTQEIVSSYEHFVDYFISEPDRGISDAFNKGLNVANMDIVGLINSDDTLLPGAILSVRQAFQSNPEVEVVHGDILLYDGEQFVKQISPAGKWWFPWRLVLFNHPATFVKRDVYKRFGGFSSEFKFAMDDDLFLTWIQEKVQLQYTQVAFVRMQAGGLSGRFAFQVFKEKRKTLLAHGYNPLLVNLQYVARFGVQIAAYLQKIIRDFRTGSMVSTHDHTG
ncbi:MAG: glycosyltransferase [Desulfuromonadales bacterium]|nr:glycosyltransferase [Desulfuromonadales bacterium]